MAAKAKTKELLRVDVALDLLADNEGNPNEMADREFDLLVRNMDDHGWTDPALIAPIDPVWFAAEVQKINQKKLNFPDLWSLMRAQKQQFRIVGGHHRVKAARYLHFTEGPMTINMDPAFDREQQDIQLIRHNVIHGSLNPIKFIELYKKYVAKYSAEIMAETFGFADQAVLDNLIKQASKDVPAHLKQKFREAAAEIKSVDDLEKLLQRLFLTFGDTLKYGYMFLDHMGKDSVWLRVDRKTWAAILTIGEMCHHKNRTMDDVVGRVLQLIASGKADTLMKVVTTTTPKVEIPDDFAPMPTKDNLEKLEAME